MLPPARVGALSDDARLTSVCLSVAYIGPKSRTEKPRKIKSAHVTCDSDTTFRVKRSTCRGAAYCGGLPHSSYLLSCCFEANKSVH